MRSHQFLLSLTQETVVGLKGLQDLLETIRSKFKIEKVSSFYKRYYSAKNEDLNSEIILVLKGTCDEDASALQDGLIEIVSKAQKTSLILLSFDQLVQISPDLTLPHPKLVRDPALLRCASEVWGEYEHPILGQSLNEIVKSVNSFEHVEFFAQGETYT